MTSTTIEGGPLRRWLESATDDRQKLLVGYYLDDGENEWLVDSTADHGLLLILLGPDGITQMARRKKLPVSGIEDSYVFWGDEPSLHAEISASRPPLQVRIDEALHFVLGWGWPSNIPLGPTSLDFELVLKRLESVAEPGKEEDLDRFADIAERSPQSALVAANWLKKYISRGGSLNPSLEGHCRIHASSLFRVAGRFEEALKVTDILATGETSGLSQSAIATMCVTRAAALMDKFEVSQGAANSQALLADSRKLLNRSYAIHGGGNEYHQNTFFRLLSLERSLRRDE